MIEMTAAALSALIVSFLLVPLSARIARRKKRLDIPNERSSHKVPTPRTGGVGIVLGGVAAWGATCAVFGVPIQKDALFTVCILVAGAAAGFGDDLFGIKSMYRLLFYLSCAACLAGFGARVTSISVPIMGTVYLSPLTGMVLCALLITWYANLFNFMDGIDGIAGAAGLVTMGALSFLFGRTGEMPEALFAAATAGAALGFLFFNFPRASVFMGDGGAVFMGLSAGALSLRAVNKGLIDIYPALLLMFPFVFDATFTLFRRMLKREKFWTAHRGHVYQQLCDLGFRHATVSIFYFIAAIACALLGLFFHLLPLPAKTASFLGIPLLFFLLFLYVIYRNRSSARAKEKTS